MKFVRFTSPSGDRAKILKALKTKPAKHWEKLGEMQALALFHHTSQTVPAYRKFLKAHGLDPANIKSIADFQTLPLTDKQSYLRASEYRDLFPGRDLSLATTISATSGSTGEPFYFPRGEDQDTQYEYAAELFLKNQFALDTKSTLGIIGFGLGVWIGGIFTYKILNRLAAKGYRLTLLPMGPNKELYLRSVKKFGAYFDQVLLMGYPPFIKDILDEAGNHGIQWNDYKIKILTATETFSEEFREYLTEHAAIKNPYTDIINIYGTVELGTMAHETALTTLIRKLALQDAAVFKNIFAQSSRLPTLAQYHPYLCYLEEVDGEVIGSGMGSSIPLVRYRFHDRGGVIPFETLLKKLRERGIDIIGEARRIGISQTIMHLPFVYVFERSDMSATLFGITIYPEYIRSALARREVTRTVTGKFTMITKNDRKQDQFLEINVELRKGVRSSLGLAHLIQNAVVDSLMRRSTEYNYLSGGSSPTYRKRLRPKIALWPYEDPLYFKPGGKQAWVKK